MIQRRSQLSSSRWMPLYALVILIAASLACNIVPAPQPGGQDTTGGATSGPPAGETPGAALPTETPVGDTPTPVPALPTTVPGAAPGTIMFENAFNLQGGAEQQGTFDSTPMQTVRIDSTILGGTLEYELQLVDKFTNPIATLQSTVGRTTESIVEFTLPYEGEYVIKVIPIGGIGTVRVAVTALGPSSGGGFLTGTGTSASGLMSAGHIYHTYQFPLAQGEVVTIAARANLPEQPDTRMVIYGPDGRFVTEVDDEDPANSKRDAVAPNLVVAQAGTYVAIVANYGGTTGAYVFSIQSATEVPEAEGAASIVYGQALRGRFADQSNLSATFDGTVGDIIEVVVFDSEAALDVDIYVYSPFGQIIAFARDARQGQGETLNELQLPYTGRYRLELRPIGSGDASFQINRLDVSQLTGGGVFGDEVSKTLRGAFGERNVFHIYQFNAVAGETISLVVASRSQRGSLDIGFAVLGPNGLQLAFADHSEGSNPNDPALLDFPATQSGTYTVIVYLFNDAAGTYDITFSRE